MALEGVALIPCAQPFFLHVPHRWLRVNPQKHSCCNPPAPNQAISEKYVVIKSCENCIKKIIAV